MVIQCPVCKHQVPVVFSALLEKFLRPSDILPKVGCPGCDADIPAEDWRLVELINPAN